MDNRPAPPLPTSTREDQLVKDVASIKLAVWIIATLMVLAALWAGVMIFVGGIG